MDFIYLIYFIFRYASMGRGERDFFESFAFEHYEPHSFSIHVVFVQLLFHGSINIQFLFLMISNIFFCCLRRKMIDHHRHHHGVGPLVDPSFCLAQTEASSLAFSGFFCRLVFSFF